MPEIIIVAGPNGAGKTSFANIYLPERRQRYVYVNADEIARESQFSQLSETGRNLQAGKEMLARIDATTSAGLDLMFETTLATLVHAKKKFPHGARMDIAFHCFTCDCPMSRRQSSGSNAAYRKAVTTFPKLRFGGDLC